MQYSEVVAPGSLLFAPMEGITDGPYRKVIERLFPEWHRQCCDFLRVPSEGRYSEKKIIEHFGRSEYENEDIRKRTTYQILTSPTANTADTVKKIRQLGFKHLDLNLGCPSKKVNSHKGGAFLLSDLYLLKEVVSNARENFPDLFTVKIRIGYRNTEIFEEILETLESCSVDAITIHGRTRDQLYKGRANWDFIKLAVEKCKVPIIGNGDIWTTEDIDNIFKQTGCHAAMVARGALQTPWLAKLYRLKAKDHFINKDQELKLRRGFIKAYYRELEKEYTEIGWEEGHLHRRFKGLTRYLIEELPEGQTIRSQLLRSKKFTEFKNILASI